MFSHLLTIVGKWIGCLGILIWFNITKSDFAFCLGVLVSIFSIANSAVSIRKNWASEGKVKSLKKFLKPKSKI